MIEDKPAAQGRVCVICGVGIEGRDPQARTCGKECKHVLRANEQRARRMAERGVRQKRACQWCGALITGRMPQAKFCSSACQTLSALDRIKQTRLRSKQGRRCAWCGGVLDVHLQASAKYCCIECRDHAILKRNRDKIAEYRASDPVRYREHRMRENERRVMQRSALKLIREIQSNGLEALL